LLYYGEAAKLVYDRPRAPADGETLVAKMYLNGARRAVAQRDDDILTADELRVHAKEVAAAMLKELLTWAKLKCLGRRSKREANNIIDCRWVTKWKHEISTISLTTDKSQGPATG